MQLIKLASAAALLATVSATASSTSFNNNGTCDESRPKVRVFNRCSYDVYLWSVLKGQGCPSEEGVMLETGRMYQENYREDGDTGVSIKISKEPKCKGIDCVQLEYFIDNSAQYGGNYHDVSYVDCLGGDCPTKQEGFYMKTGNENGLFMANDNNDHCPILSCSNSADCAKISYILPDDTQTKFCSAEANIDFYMCGGEAPGEDSSYTPAPSSQQADSEAPAPTSAQASKTKASSIQATSTEASNNEEQYGEYAPSEAEVEAAAVVTPAPAVQAPNVKTVVEYVTQYEYVNAKRHAHGHRHQHFRA